MANLDDILSQATWLRRVWCVALMASALGCGGPVDDPESGDSRQALAPPGSNSQFVSASFKPEWYPGERVRVSFTLKNNGTTDWTATNPIFALASLDRGWDWRYTATPVTVPVGSSHDFDFVVSAPSAPGDYSFVARMRAIGLGDFGATITRAATVTPSATPEWGCAYVASASDVPARLAPNENRAVVVTVRNVGQKPWQPGFYLVTEDSPAALWGQTNLPLNETVAAGANKTWSFGIRAPGTAGTYQFRREMADTTALGVGEFRRQDFCVDLSIEVAGSTPLDSNVVSQDFRSTVAPGEAFSETVTLRNTGTETWLADGSYVLSSLNSPVSLWGRTSVSVTTVTAPGASATLTLPLRAPATPGTYEQGWQLRKLSGTNAGFFGATATASVVVDQATTPVYGASVVDQNIPLRMTTGKAYPVQVKMQNTGSVSWSGASFGLVSTNLPAALWKTTLTSLAASETVAPGGTRTFSFQLHAPAAVGTYSSSWRMKQSGGVGLFGQPAQVDGIEVTQCGNRTLDSGETCDDGNLAAGDGCSPTCQRECGNGQLDPGEACDDGNVVAGDGCSPTCQHECGNGQLDPGEACDDGNVAAGDGCSPTCQRECGNGQLDPGEACDDGNVMAGDGCSPTCQRECGNGQVDPNEECDGGNFGGATCDSVTSGTKPLGLLSCTTACKLDSSACEPAPSNCTDGVVFADPVLEYAVREALGGSLPFEGPILPADAAQLTSLFLQYASLSSLEGLECFTNLGYLGMYFSQVSDLQPLANLPQLTDLEIYDSQVSSLQPLANLTQLFILWVKQSPVSDLTPLANLTHLENLDLGDDEIESLAGLSNMTHLVFLNFEGNAVSDLTPLAGLPIVDLRFSSNRVSDLGPLASMPLRSLDGIANLISDLTPLAGITSLQEIYLSGNTISTLAPLVQNSGVGTGDTVVVELDPTECPYETNNINTLIARGVNLQSNCGDAVVFADRNLESRVRGQLGIYTGPITPRDAASLVSLTADGASIVSLSGLEYFINLRALSLSNNQIRDLTPLARLTHLETLGLSHNVITNVTPLAGLTQLTSLLLSQNSIERVDGLSNLSSLLQLYLDQNQLSDLEPLANLTRLTELRLQDNRIETLNGLSNMAQLLSLAFDRNTVSNLAPLTNLSSIADLRFSGNHVSDLSPLASLPQLLHLDGGNNVISDLTPLTDLGTLQRIYLAGNQISTLAPLVQNSGVAGGDTLVLTNNPLVCSSEASNIQTLANRGVNLETDCGSGESCVERKILGTYGFQAHSEIRLCQKSDFSCFEPTVADAPATISLYAEREDSASIRGEYHGPGIVYYGQAYASETWDEPPFFYYPEAGNTRSIWDQYYPAQDTGGWDPNRAGSWVRVAFQTCWDEGQPGFVHIDIELATGRILDFARKCQNDYDTVWYDYRLSGTGRLECAGNTCNSVTNSASAAEIVKVNQSDTMNGCQLTSGTYHLVSVRYFDGNEGTCQPPLSSIRETLVVDATSASTGTMNFATEESPGPFSTTFTGPFSTAMTYRLSAGSNWNLSTTLTCGSEELAPPYSQTTCATSGSELKIQQLRGGCYGTATYVYQKQ